jgi:dihydrofolate reductase
MTVFKSFIATSLDGFIAREDGAIDWLTEGWPDAGHDHGHADFMAGIDAIIMGRGTFDTVRGFDPWPYDKPCIVMSRTLQAAAIPAGAAGSVEITPASPAEVAAGCAARGLRGVYVDGGRILSAFIAAGLLDEIIITRLPVLIGSGRPLFEVPGRDVRVETVESTLDAGGFVQTRYRFAKA